MMLYGDDKMITDNMVKKTRKNWRKLLRMLQKKENSDIVIFTHEMVNEYAKFHRELQATIAIVGNYRAGVDVKNKDFNPGGIYKTEGGVKVDNKDIVIIKKYDGNIRCYNDWDNREKDTPRIVQEVVEEILRIRPDGDVEDVLITYAKKNTDVPTDVLREKISRFAINPYIGDSLWGLFGR
jgi:hypothetical protein